MTLQPRKRPMKSVKNRNVAVNDRALAFARGELTIDDLDEEEIRRAQFRNKAGDFRGRPSDLIPREFHDEVARQAYENVMRRLATMTLEAMKTLEHAMRGNISGVGANAAVRAAEIVLQYNIGKVPDKVELKAMVETWEHTIDGAVVNWGELNALPMAANATALADAESEITGE